MYAGWDIIISSRLHEDVNLTYVWVLADPTKEFYKLSGRIGKVVASNADGCKIEPRLWLSCTDLYYARGAQGVLPMRVGVRPTNSYWYRKTRGVKKFHLFGAICLLEYILLIKEQIARVSRLFVLKNYIVKIFLVRNRSRNLFLYYVCTSMLTWCNRWMVSYVDTICYVCKILRQKK